MDKLGNKILFTGATGIIGSTVAKFIAEQGWDVIGVARSRPQWWMESCEFIEVDLANANIKELVSSFGQLKHIIHLCDLSKKSIEENVKVANELSHYGIKHNIDKFLYASSIRVYGSKFGKIDETTIPKPFYKDEYALSKMMIEKKLVKNFRKTSSKLCILRLGSVFSKATKNKVPRKSSALKRMILFGKNTHLISVNNVAHVVNWILMNRCFENIEVLNITQEADGKNNYFMIADQLNGENRDRKYCPNVIGAYLRYILCNFTGHREYPYFSQILEKRLIELKYFYPYSLIDEICKIYI